MNLINDDSLDRAKRFSGVGGQQKVKRLWRRDQNFAGMFLEPRTISRRRVAGADADLRYMHRDAFALRHVRDARERRTKIALHVNSQRLERRNIEDATSLPSRRLAQHEFVETPEKCRQRLARASRREDECRFAARDRRPGFALRR